MLSARRNRRVFRADSRRIGVDVVLFPHLALPLKVWSGAVNNHHNKDCFGGEK